MTQSVSPQGHGEKSGERALLSRANREELYRYLQSPDARTVLCGATRFPFSGVRSQTRLTEIAIARLCDVDRAASACTSSGLGSSLSIMNDILSNSLQIHVTVVSLQFTHVGIPPPPLNLLPQHILQLPSSLGQEVKVLLIELIIRLLQLEQLQHLQRMDSFLNRYPLLHHLDMLLQLLGYALRTGSEGRFLFTFKN